MPTVFRESDVIDLLRKKQGDLTQREFAKLANVQEGYLSDIFHGRRMPGPRILEFLGLERAYCRKA